MYSTTFQLNCRQFSLAFILLLFCFPKFSSSQDIEDFEYDIDHTISSLNYSLTQRELEDIQYDIEELVEDIEDKAEDRPRFDNLLERAELLENFVSGIQEEWGHIKREAVRFANEYIRISRVDIWEKGSCLEVERWQVGRSLYLIAINNNNEDYLLRFKLFHRTGGMEGGVGPNEVVIVRKFFNESKANNFTVKSLECTEKTKWKF